MRTLKTLLSMMVTTLLLRTTKVYVVNMSTEEVVKKIKYIRQCMHGLYMYIMTCNEHL